MYYGLNDNMGIYNYLSTNTKNKIVLKIIFLLSLLMIPSVNALAYINTCLNDSYLEKQMLFTHCGSNCTDYNFTQVIECGFGCDNVTHVCREARVTEYGNYFKGVLWF